MTSSFITQLLDDAAYPHAVDKLELIETHISWVILTGQFAYKIKKPVDLGFLDFSSLARRKHFCEEELRLNQRTAPDLYLEVVPIANTVAGLRVGLEPAIEYALRMQQFPHGARLDRQLQSGQLSEGDMVSLAAAIARFHATASPSPPGGHAANIEQIRQFALENFDQLKAALGGQTLPPLIDPIEGWTRDQLTLLKPVFQSRAKTKFIREGHGDLHLGNIVKLGDRFVLFDCIEFDAKLRWLDVMNDIAFLTMDLMAQGRNDLAFVFLSAYLEHKGDYFGIAVLRYYLVYRSMVRAKVAAIQRRADNKPAGEDPDREMRRYLELARTLQQCPIAPRLFLMHGFSGTGKSWLSSRLIGPLGAIRIRSDLERKRLHGLTATESSQSGIDAGLYDTDSSEQTYDSLAQYCEIGLRAGFNMIADASFLRHRHRQRFFGLARRLQRQVVILDCTAPIDLIRTRIQERAQRPSQVSEADLQVLEHQLAHHDPLTEREERCVIRVPMDDSQDFPALLRRLNRLQGQENGTLHDHYDKKQQ